MSPIYYDWQRMHIRPLTTLEDCKRVAALEKTVWGLSDAEDVVPPITPHRFDQAGGILLGAFDGAGEMQGFVYSMPGSEGRPPDAVVAHARRGAGARDAGLGTRLKLAQREAAIAMGLELIEWTFDPLQALNAHFNFAKLGVVVEEYERRTSTASRAAGLHRGAPTDRFVAAWRITTAHVERRIASMDQPLVRDARVMAAPVVNPSGSWSRHLSRGRADLTCDEPRLLVEIPTDYDKTLLRDPALALAWRLSNARHLRIVLRARLSGRGLPAVRAQRAAASTSRRRTVGDCTDVARPLL